MKIEFWWEDKEVVEHQIKSSSLAWMTVAPAAEWFLWAHTVGPGCSHVSIWTTENALICVRIEILRVCVCRHAWEKCVLYCMSESDFSVCQWRCVRVCVRACACMMEGVEELGLSMRDQHHSDWEDPRPALMATHVNSTTPKNRSVEHNTLTQIDTHAPVSTQRIAVCQSRQCLVAPSATHVQHCHAHLPAEQTRPLDWNNRIKIEAERTSEPTPSLFDRLPHLPL